MTSFKHQFWLYYLVTMTGCLAVNNLTSWSGSITCIQIVFLKPVCIKRFENIWQYLSDNSQHSTLRPVHLPLHPGSRCHTTLQQMYSRHATTAQVQQMPHHSAAHVQQSCHYSTVPGKQPAIIQIVSAVCKRNIWYRQLIYYSFFISELQFTRKMQTS
jgi:hypothetical protein